MRARARAGGAAQRDDAIVFNVRFASRKSIVRARVLVRVSARRPTRIATTLNFVLPAERAHPRVGVRFRIRRAKLATVRKMT